jgi:hypothetical protein
MNRLTGRDVLRLAIPSPDRTVAAPRRAATAPADAATTLAPGDPRWVLAVRTAELLQGAVLGPDDREQLLRTGRVLGLNPFQSNLVIAVVQDQARRGLGPGHGVRELAFIPPAAPASHVRPWRVALVTAALIVVESLLLWAVL